MNQYELTVVLAGSMPEAKQKAVLERIKKAVADSGGSVAKTDEWGKKELAFKIRGEGQGFYYFFELSLPPDRTGGVNRTIENDEQVLRHLLVVKSVKGTTRSTSSGQAGTTSSEKQAESPEQSRGIDKEKKKGKIGKGKSNSVTQ